MDVKEYLLLAKSDFDNIVMIIALKNLLISKKIFTEEEFTDSKASTVSAADQILTKMLQDKCKQNDWDYDEICKLIL